MKRKILIVIILKALIVSILIFFSVKSNRLEETIKIHPIDENITFTDTFTILKFDQPQDNDEYTINWSTTSKSDEKIDVRLDLSLLFEDGLLRDTMLNSKQKIDILKKESHIHGEDSGLFQAVSFHQGEIHYQNEVKKNIQKTSYDQLYVLDSPLSPNEAFKVAKSKSQREGKHILEKIIQQNLQYTWEELIEYFNIPSHNYNAIPLTKLPKYDHVGLPDLSCEDTQKITQLVFDAIYHNYFLGLRSSDNELIDPAGSTLPLILFHKSYSHFIILFESNNGTKYHIVKNTRFIIKE